MTASASASFTTSPLSHYAFPRTGKRGVPQQFPRRLYEMLEAEETQLQASVDHPRIISWSESGRAFRIYDVPEFSTSILPKYFRTKKFSSFQRNLNLYGFAKVRRGPESDMYAHPSFLRDKPESLVSLRKIINGARNKRSVQISPIDDDDYSTTEGTHPAIDLCRPVSPSSPSSTSTGSYNFEQDSSSPVPVHQMVITKIPEWSSPSSYSSSRIEERPGFSSFSFSPSSVPQVSSGSDRDRGKLDLLALALERAAALSSSA